MNHRMVAVVNIAWALAAASRGFAEDAPSTLSHAPQLAILALPAKSGATLDVSSPAFKNGGDLPFENTQYRGNIFPGLKWSAGPNATKSYAVIMQGALGRGTSVHLTLINVPANVTQLDAGMTAPPQGASYGPNVHGLNAPYSGPHTHSFNKQPYHIQVFALDTAVDAKPGVGIADIEEAMRGHVLASGEIVGLATMDPESEEAKELKAKEAKK